MKSTHTHTPIERDRDATEQRLLEALGVMIGREGFEKIGINALSAQAGVSKILIYRYFGSIEGLMAAYIRRYDFWINFPAELPESEQLPNFLKSMFRGHINRLRQDPVLRRLNRWELSADNEMTATLRTQREQRGLALVRAASVITGRPESSIAPIATLLSAAVTYLAMLGEFCPSYNGIPIDTDAGWEQIADEIDHMIDRWVMPDKN